MYFFKLMSVFFIFFIQVNVLHAEWNPSYLPFDKSYTLENVNDPQLISIENSVCDYLKNSWCSQEKARLLLELIAIVHPKVCVEVGAFSGSSSLPILAGLQYLGKGKGYMIDAWSNEEAIRGLPSNDPNTEWWKTLSMSWAKNQFHYMIDYWSLGSFCKTLHMTSAQAILKIPNIDFLHLDGNFSEEGALLDSELYVSKVVPGGYILLSNALVMIAGKPTKMRALWPLFEHCDIICEIDQGNVLLFRKKQSR